MCVSAFYFFTWWLWNTEHITYMILCCAQTPQIKGSTGSCMHNSPVCRLYQCPIRIKRRYAVLKGHRERDNVRLPASVQISNCRPLPCYIRGINPATQDIWSGQPRQCRPRLLWCTALVRLVRCIEQPCSVLIVASSNWIKLFLLL